MCCYGNEDTDRVKTCDRCEHLVKVYSLPLHIAFRDQPCLVFHNCTGGVALGLENSFQSDRAVACREVSQCPRTVLLD
jgi:hypothetical protein